MQLLLDTLLQFIIYRFNYNFDILPLFAWINILNLLRAVGLKEDCRRV